MALIPIAVANGRGPWRGGDMREGVACRGAGYARGEGHDGGEVHIHHRGWGGTCV